MWADENRMPGPGQHVLTMVQRVPAWPGPARADIIGCDLFGVFMRNVHE